MPSDKGRKGEKKAKRKMPEKIQSWSVCIFVINILIENSFIDIEKTAAEI